MRRNTLPLRALAALYLLLGLVPLANVIAPGSVRWWDAAAAEWMTRGAILLLVALLVILVFADRTDTAFGEAGRRLLAPSPRAFSIAVSVFAIAISLGLAFYCFAGVPFTSDEMAQQWHARILLSGHLTAHAEASREFFNTAPVYDANGRWFSQYPIGGPAFIALGLAIGAPWLVNPVLLGLGTWQLYRFLRIATDEIAARSVTLLFVTSPMVLIMAASQMNHVPALTFALLALAQLAAWDAASPERRTRHALGAGAAIGVVVLVRPLDGAVLALCVGAFQAWRAWRDRALVPSCVAGLGTLLVPVALLLVANAQSTGSPSLFGYEALNGPEHALGFHVDPNGEMHTPLRGIRLASGYMMRLSRYLFEWPLPGVLAIAGGLLVVRRATRFDALLAALTFALLAAYAAYWFDGFFAGPRFLYTALPGFVYFAARGPFWLANAPPARFAALRRLALLVVPLCVFVTWFGPVGVSSARARVTSYHEQRTKLKTDIDAQVRRAGLRNALVFVNEGWRGRLEARLRVLGVSQFRAERVLSTVDACALQSALDAEDSLADPDLRARADRAIARAAAYGPARLEVGRQADQAIALVPGSRPTPECLREFLSDTAGTISYPIFLARQRVQSDGRIGGNVVFARDLGARDTVLRSRFGERTWYRYRPGASLSDTSLAFLPFGASR